jgi:hypothetical protein
VPRNVVIAPLNQNPDLTVPDTVVQIRGDLLIETLTHTRTLALYVAFIDSRPLREGVVVTDL